MITPEMLAQYRKIILRPVVTEKSMAQAEGAKTGTKKGSKYTFEVDPQANKTEIRRAVEALWSVRVVGVNTMTVRGKERRHSYRHRIGKTAQRKKAIVTLAQGQTIDVLAGG
ncbi:MAG: 50S ribosomal protein L23 [Armatimonadetes bacterium]|nr:50S ribosomal protein L23 [Armatimonadota bacterium]